MDPRTPRTVYSVSEGEYSDYGIVALFEDRADAEANASRHSDWYVQEFDLYPQGSWDVMVPRKRFSATVWVDNEGRIVDLGSVRDNDEYPDPGPMRTFTAVYASRLPISINGVRLPEGQASSSGYEISTSADSEERVRKVVRERAAKVAAAIAQGEPVKTTLP